METETWDTCFEQDATFPSASSAQELQELQLFASTDATTQGTHDYNEVWLGQSLSKVKHMKATLRQAADQIMPSLEKVVEIIMNRTRGRNLLKTVADEASSANVHPKRIVQGKQVMAPSASRRGVKPADVMRGTAWFFRRWTET
jgi:hypothetical protein